MELSHNSIQGLRNIQDANIMNDETFEQLLEIAIGHILGNSSVKSIAQIYGSKPDIVKGAFADITSLLVEAARHNCNDTELSDFLSASNIEGPKAERIRSFYTTHLNGIKEKLERIGHGLPHVVDVDWRLDYCIKSDTESSIGVPIYHIQLSTEKQGELRHVKFTCTPQELQELVYKLKDAVRRVEKVASM
ncbi:COMM domain-containing protein 3 [Orussus abietinus]|uniref:COMM domain-containing protein 3 n=1 Tax=Orussus abietinus TaxID=222816 RepID=UPI000625B79B|nr:COMM domain-containing protein 3 [Orussus abietinus]